MNGQSTLTQATIANIHDVTVQAIARAAGDDFDALPSAELNDAVAVEINNQLKDLAGVA